MHDSMTDGREVIAQTLSLVHAKWGTSHEPPTWDLETELRSLVLGETPVLEEAVLYNDRLRNQWIVEDAAHRACPEGMS